MKIFCIGLQKTGTSSMRDALSQLGYKVTGVFGQDQSLKQLRETYVGQGLEIAQNFDAVEDMPWALMFRDLDKAFPDSKFILTIRNSDNWFTSISRHFGSNPSHMQQLTYGENAPSPVGHEAHYRKVYEAHNAEVIAYFSDRPEDLLIMSLEDGDGWQKLGAFLDREDVPQGAFVHTNSANQRNSLLERVKIQLRRIGIPVKVMSR